MTDWGVYWKWFGQTEEPRTVTGWRIGEKSRLADARKGDRLWLFTSGKLCKKNARRENAPQDGYEDNLAYLAEVFTVENIVREDTGEFPLLINGNPDKCCRGGTSRVDRFDRKTHRPGYRHFNWYLPARSLAIA